MLTTKWTEKHTNFLFAGIAAIMILLVISTVLANAV